ncbi:MAG: putative peptidyl-prolyl cis-trans isomerase [Bacteroidota bacterium]|nr:MAG: putative peptidyl-prolyl cis-trans isomerase [Bacteroidota bacterium]
MQKHYWKHLFYYVVAGVVISCSSPKQPKKPQGTIVAASATKPVQKPVEKKSDLPLTAETAIQFLQRYAAENPENKVRIETPLGSFDILLFDQTPYHRANFIFLAKQKYYDGTYFHRVVPEFIIQGGNSDNYDTGHKRRKIGKYLLPPDTRNGLKHHRGVVSMPSSEIENPHKLASPYEFFIVHQSPGAYHLDGNYTVFGKVIRGMEVVDAINALPTDKREWPLTNMRMRVTVLTQ